MSARILVRVRLVDDPRVEVGEDVRVGVSVRVGAMECQLSGRAFARVPKSRRFESRPVRF